MRSEIIITLMLDNAEQSANLYRFYMYIWNRSPRCMLDDADNKSLSGKKSGFFFLFGEPKRPIKY